MALRALTPNTVTNPTMAPSERPEPISAMAATLPIRLKGRLTSTSQVLARQRKQMNRIRPISTSAKPV